MNPNRIFPAGQPCSPSAPSSISICILVLLLLTASASSAQMYSVPMRHTVQTPYGPASFTTYQHRFMPMYYGNGSISARYPFTIVLKDDSVVQAKAKINIRKTQQKLNFRKDNLARSFKPDETKEIYRVLKDGTKFSGIPADSCWLFKAVTGKINGYGLVAEKGYDYVVAIQEEDGQIVPLSEDNLRPMIQDHPEAMKYFEKKRYTQAIKIFNTVKNPSE